MLKARVLILDSGLPGCHKQLEILGEADRLVIIHHTFNLTFVNQIVKLAVRVGHNLPVVFL